MVRGRQRGDLGPDLRHALELQVGAELVGELGGDGPVGTGGAGRGDLLVQRAHATLEVGGRAVHLGEAGDRQDDVGLLGRGREELVERDQGGHLGQRLAGQVLVGEVGERVGPEQHQHLDPAVGGGLQDAGGVEARLLGHRAPRPREPLATGVECHAAREQPRGEAHVERTVDVRPPHRGQEARVRQAAQEGRRRVGGPLVGLGHGLTADDHLHRGGRVAEHVVRSRERRRIDAAAVLAGGDAVEQRPRRLGDLAGTVEQRDGRQAGEAGGLGGQLDHLDVVVGDGVAQAQEQDRQLFLDVRSGEDDRAARGAHVVDRGLRQPDDELGRQAVGELGVDVVGADDALRQLRPRVRGLVGQARAAEHGDRSRPVAGQRVVDRRRGLAERVGPAHRLELAVALHERLPEATIAVDGLEVEAALVAQPAPVDGIDVDAEVAQHLVARGLHGHAAAHRARLAGRLGLLEVPGAGLEAVRLGRQRAHGADLHGVAAEVRRERVVGEGVDLGVVAPVHEVDQRVAGHLLGEARAAVAQDAALAVEEDHVADRDRLLLVALLLDEARLAGPVGHRLVLQRALAALVAHGAVERVVDQQELEHPVLGLLGDRGLGVDLHVRRALEHAARLQRRAPTGVDLDDAHAAHADGLHARVGAEVRDVDAVALRRVDDELALVRHDRCAVEGDRDAFDGRRLLLLRAGGVSHGPPPPAHGWADPVR